MKDAEGRMELVAAARIACRLIPQGTSLSAADIAGMPLGSSILDGGRLLTIGVSLF